MSYSPNRPCPADETLALFAVGDLDAETRNDVLAHIETCRECMAAVLSATAHLHEEASKGEGEGEGEETIVPPVSGPWRWWMSAAAAAVILAVLAFPLLRGSRDRIGGLVALAPASERTVEPRLSGGFAWAPYRGPMRSTTTAAGNTARLKLGGAAGEVIEHAEHDPSAEAQHAAGVAMMLVERTDEAAARLEGAARASHDAKTWSDLAAARYAAAVQSRQPSLLPAALAAATEALRNDPRLPEALFNRALIMERTGTTAEARQAWLRYLQADAQSPWAAEARAHLSELGR